MEQRDFILKLLHEYQPSDDDEKESLLLIIDFIKNYSRCFDYNYFPRHVTGSAIVVDREYKFVLLNQHKKLDKWLQFGGHADGHPNPLEVAFREAQEESGLKSLKLILDCEGIFDVDVHTILKHGDTPKHDHYDIRIILSADRHEQYTVSHESNNLKWTPLTEAFKFNSDPSFLRLIKKAQILGDQIL